jgi:hypothetical protein
LIPTSDEGKLGGVGNMTQSATTLYFTKSFQFQNQLPEANVSRPFAGGFERKSIKEHHSLDRLNGMLL